ncbi:C45 family peptidase [Rhizobium sp. BE258]|uniref:C45 family peptidase n=1 Tax=Rhizobium sp. BE258 TaxID=2817722 RepID=UPI00285783E0|nr:C45 family peptidase [Rhizobium sp. BE258]MDR7145139.1 isopenicillin-N N-acyltransferase-like protein [Rhizobium sp. BE258]
MAEQIPVIVLRGSPMERGRQHGAHLRGLIVKSIDSTRRAAGQGGWERARLKSAGCIERLSATSPDIADEIRGIADGAALAPPDVLLLSAFEYLGESQTGCTSAGFARADGAVVGQNWDAPAGTERNLAVLVHEGPDRHLVMVASAGTLGWVGMNEHGLAFVNNDLILDEAAEGLPSLVIRRLMLDQRTVEGAMAVLRINRHMSGRCFMVGDAYGGLRVAELGPSAGVTDRPFRRTAHTNHPLFAKPAMWEDIEAVARIYPSSRGRLRAARRFSLSSIDDVSELLCDRCGAPDAIAKTPSSREPTGTAFSVIFDCSRREALVALGRPDPAAYRRIAMMQPAGA